MPIQSDLNSIVDNLKEYVLQYIVIILRITIHGVEIAWNSKNEKVITKRNKHHGSSFTVYINFLCSPSVKVYTLQLWSHPTYTKEEKEKENKNRTLRIDYETQPGKSLIPHEK